MEAHAAHPLDRLAQDLCGIFLGWRLREDFDALRSLGEGTLRIDLLSGEAWCDDEPLPPLFIAGALRGELEKQRADLRRAELHAEFAARTAYRGARELPTLDLACRVSLCGPGGEFGASARNTA